MLEHKDEGAVGCLGQWRMVGLLVGPDDVRSIRCDRCGAEYPATPENRLAAINENYAGIWLRRMTAAGAAQLPRRTDD